MSDKDTEALFVFGGLINFSYICAELILYQRLKQIESMKTKVLLAAVAVAFSFAVTSCGNKKAADSNATEADSCCADRKSTRLNSSHNVASRMPSSA